MSMPLIALAAVFGPIVAYGLLRYRVISATQDFRLSAGKKALDLVENQQLPEGARILLLRMATSAFDGRIPWQFTFCLIRSVFSRRRVTEDLHEIEDVKLRNAFHVTVAKMVFANLLTSPLAFLLCVATLAFGTLTLGTIQSIISRFIRAANQRFDGRHAHG